MTVGTWHAYVQKTADQQTCTTLKQCIEVPYIANLTQCDFAMMEDIVFTKTLAVICNYKPDTGIIFLTMKTAAKFLGEEKFDNVFLQNI